MLRSTTCRWFASQHSSAGVAYPVVTELLGHAVGGDVRLGHIDVSLEEKVEAVERLPKVLGRA